jgi:mRNA interferase HigB
VNVISRRKLKDFYNTDSTRRNHANAFEDWFRIARKAHWQNFQDAKATFGQTDVATGSNGGTATIFDIGGNKYRVVAQIDYRRQTILIKAVLDHKQYDKGFWKKLF